MAAEPAAKAQESGRERHPVIIKRRKKVAAEAHHGGAWKVAYADFVTAMMAFFLLLWLLNATTEEQKQGISNYFAPESVSYSRSGSGEILDGNTIVEDAPKGLTGVVIPVPLPPGQGTGNSDAGADGDGNLEGRTGPDFSSLGGYGDSDTPGELTESEMRELAEAEEKQFEAAEEALREAIEGIPELQDLGQNLVIDRTEEGLRIQIVDQSGISMFPRGSSAMYEYTERLIAQVVEAVAHLPNRVSVTGHTDAIPYVNPAGYGNWELSSDRANASRRALLNSGMPAERIVRVTGKADREPLIKENPKDPRNRRISIVLLREVPLPKNMLSSGR